MDDPALPDTAAADAPVDGARVGVPAWDLPAARAHLRVGSMRAALCIARGAGQPLCEHLLPVARVHGGVAVAVEHDRREAAHRVQLTTAGRQGATRVPM